LVVSGKIKQAGLCLQAFHAHPQFLEAHFQVGDVRAHQGGEIGHAALVGIQRGLGVGVRLGQQPACIQRGALAEAGIALPLRMVEKRA